MYRSLSNLHRYRTCFRGGGGDVCLSSMNKGIYHSPSHSLIRIVIIFLHLQIIFLFQCSAHCGEGVRQRRVVCLGGGACSPADRPVTSEACRAERTCAGEWMTGRWSVCSHGCGKGKQKRKLGRLGWIAVFVYICTWWAEYYRKSVLHLLSEDETDADAVQISGNI